MKIEVYYTKNCPKCPAAKQICKELAKEFNLEYSEIDIEENLIDALQKGIASAPTVLIDGKIVSRSSVPEKEKLIKIIKGTSNG
ncbi:MAG: thioredoxin family protein [Candidatus Aenigmatarchaeota archaeon]|nr:thioredoxin family protein [Candidatus Aenigmarchaeota archaeon]